MAIVEGRKPSYLVKLRPPTEPAGCGNIDARDRFCNAVAAIAPVRAPLRGRRDPARRDAGALGPLRHRGVLRDDPRRDRRLLVIEPSAEGISEMTARNSRLLLMAAA